MNGPQLATTIVTCMVTAYLLQAGWRRWRENERQTTLMRNIEASEELLQHSKEFLTPEIIQVTPNIYVALGYALANSIMIEGPDSVVIVDVTESLESATEVLGAFRNITKKPISDLVYTHFHADHTGGAKAFIEDETSPPDIWAHELLPDQLTQQSVGPSEPMFARSMRQFGVFLPDSINSGIGLRLRLGEGANLAPKSPNRLVVGKEEAVTLAGMSMKIHHIPGETDDQIGIWIEDQKAFLCADDIYKAFPNLYAIRGTSSRNLNWWISSLDIILDYEPEYLIPSHTKPIIGREKIKEILTLYRDAIQYIHDQTVRWMRTGLLADDIAKILVLPEQLASHPYLRELYGTVAWSSKSVFDYYVGWFSGDPVDLSPFTKQEHAERIIGLAGGEDNALLAASQALAKGDYQWALELASHILSLNKENAKARNIKVEALASLGSRQTSANGRNYYLTAALEEVTDMKLQTPVQFTNAVIEDTTVDVMLKSLTTRFMAEDCGARTTKVSLEFTDSKTNATLQIRNSVLIVSHKDIQEPDIRLVTTETVLKDIMKKTRSPVMVLATGEMTVEGGILAFKSFFDCFSR